MWCPLISQSFFVSAHVTCENHEFCVLWNLNNWFIVRKSVWHCQNAAVFVMQFHLQRIEMRAVCHFIFEHVYYFLYAIRFVRPIDTIRRFLSLPYGPVRHLWFLYNVHRATLFTHIQAHAYYCVWWMDRYMFESNVKNVRLIGEYHMIHSLFECLQRQLLSWSSSSTIHICFGWNFFFKTNVSSSYSLSLLFSFYFSFVIFVVAAAAFTRSIRMNAISNEMQFVWHDSYSYNVVLFCFVVLCRNGTQSANIKIFISSKQHLFDCCICFILFSRLFIWHWSADSMNTQRYQRTHTHKNANTHRISKGLCCLKLLSLWAVSAFLFLAHYGVVISRHFSCFASFKWWQ